MALSDGVCEALVHEPARPWRRRRRRAGLSRIGSIAVLTAVVLAGCGLGEDAGTFMVDPSRYDAYHCNDLTAQWKALLAREKELRGLMDKADEGRGGALIGTLTYRTDYETVLGEEKVLQRTAAEKKCQLVATYQSDQTIR